MGVGVKLGVGVAVNVGLIVHVGLAVHVSVAVGIGLAVNVFVAVTTIKYRGHVGIVPWRGVAVGAGVAEYTGENVAVGTLVTITACPKQGTSNATNSPISFTSTPGPAPRRWL